MATVTLNQQAGRDEASQGFIIKAKVLIPGKGDPIQNGAVVVKDNEIAWVGAEASLPSEYKAWPDQNVPVVMPGMWDCHVHLIGWTNFQFSKFLMEHPVMHGARLARSCRDILMSGFTSVRDLGGYGPELARLAEDGTLPCAPHIYGAGSALSQTAGHGDAFDLPLNCMTCLAGAQGESSPGPLMLVDGVDECRRAVRRQIRRGARVVKVFATGGVLSRDDDPHRAQFCAAELEAMVEEATRMGRLVAAHAHGKPGIMAALKAGCGTVEHGMYLDDECADAMLDAGAILVATRTIILEGLKRRDSMDPKSYAKMTECAETHSRACRLAIKKGIRLALGTDLGLSVLGTGLSHGQSAKELGHLVDLGLTPLQAIEAATATGPLTLGPQAPKSGQLKEGYAADIIALECNPLDEITLLENISNVTHVWKAGKLLKAPEIRH